jgi:ribosome-binding factor A
VPKEFSRKSRINIQLQRELTGMIRDELTDPRVANVTVTRVDCSQDMRNASIFISVMGDDERIPEAAKTLNHASGRLRHGLGQRLKLRHIPSLHFVGDMQLVQATRVSMVIRDAILSDEGNARNRDGDADTGEDTTES